MRTFKSLMTVIDRIDYIEFEGEWYYTYKIQYDLQKRTIKFTIMHRGYFINIDFENITNYRLGPEK